MKKITRFFFTKFGYRFSPFFNMNRNSDLTEFSVSICMHKCAVVIENSSEANSFEKETRNFCILGPLK